MVVDLNDGGIGQTETAKLRNLYLEHVLSDDVRMVLHKSKLNIAQVWAVAHAEAEDFRRAEALFKSINDFRRITATERAQLFLSTLPLRLFYGWHFLPTSSRWCI